MSEQKHTLKMPRWGLPLYGQVLCWFFINVSLVFAVLWLVLRFFFGVSVGDLAGEQLRNRIEPRAELVATDLRVSAREQWQGILTNKGKDLGVKFAVYGYEDEWEGAAGLPVTLRQEVESFRAENPASDRPQGEPEGARDDFAPPRLDAPLRPERPERAGRPDRPDRPDGGPAPVGRLDGGENEGRRRPPPPRMKREPASMVFTGKGAKGGRWAVCEVYLGGEEFRHPPRGLLAIYAKKGEGEQLFTDWRPLILAGVGLILLSGLVWLPFVHRVTRRLRLMTEGAERISEGDFQVNVASARGDEIGRLSRVIQRMAGRLEVLVEGQKRFLGDTAHELCSPLVRIRMELGVMEQGLSEASKERLVSVEEEVGELARLVDELLAFSKASLAKGESNFRSVELLALCEEVSQREAMGLECKVDGGHGLSVSTDPDLLKRALGNLVRNAVRYGEGKPLRVKIEKHDDEVWIGVLDRGPGLPDGWTEWVFEPFARPEEARTREGGGAGLGLAIVKTCADSLGGRVFCRNRETGGLEVVLVIPSKD